MRLRIVESNKVVNGKNCFNIVKRGGIVVKTFITKAAAEAFLVNRQINNYTKSKSYNTDMVLINFLNETI